jgi:hypothetical protein
MKITPAMVDEVERLLAEGLVSQRKIAKLVGMSRGTVNNIAMGRRPRVTTPVDEFEPQQGPLVRCPGCGGKVYLPCLLCHVRQINAKDHALRKLAHREACRSPAQTGRVDRSCRQDRPHGGESPTADRARQLTVSTPALSAAPSASSFTSGACRQPEADFPPEAASATFPQPCAIA